METKKLGPNSKILFTNHGDEIVYSHEVAIAGFKFGVGFFRNRKYTSELTDVYLKDIDDVMLLTSEQIERMFFGERDMKAYVTWQAAFVAFIEQYGHNYKDSYKLAAEFEEHLIKNRLGVYFLQK